MEENLRPNKIISKIEDLTDVRISLEQANELLKYDEDALDLGMSRMRKIIDGGKNIQSPFGYLIKTLSSISASDVQQTSQKRGRAPGNGLATQRPASQRPSGMPVCYSLETMSRLTPTEAYAEIEKIELHGNHGLDKLLGKDISDKLRHRVCTNIAERIIWDSQEKKEFEF